MGGSGSNYRPSGTGSGSTDCSDLAFTTAVNSPGDLSGLKAGDVFILKKNTQMEVVFQRQDGRIVGKLFSSTLLKIISCLTKGYEYSARVANIEDGVCRVEVYCSKFPSE